MLSFEQALYRPWLERSATTTLWIYSGLVLVLLPAFHFVLMAIPGMPPDSLTLRLAASAISATVGLAVLLFPALRRYSSELQLVNMLPVAIVVPILVVASGNHPYYIAASLLVAVGVQQAFYRTEYLVATAAIACATEVVYSAWTGVFAQPANVVALAIVASGYFIAVVIGSLRIRIQRNELKSRYEALRMKEHLDRLAHYDMLTELPNRQTLKEHLDVSLRANGGAQCAVLFLDLDRFKDVNDTLGHSVGDVLLHALALRLRSVIPPDGLLARWGGDEFVVALSATDGSHAAEQLSKALVAAVAEPLFVDEYEFVVSVSIGIAVSPEHGADGDTLIRNADSAMYGAKQLNGIRYKFFEPGMHQSALLRQQIRSELRKAAGNGSLELHYQPIVETTTTRIVGAEALLRWRQTDGRLLNPDQFIPIAEDSGLIVPIGLWVLRTVCAQLRRWQDSGTRLTLAVNISAHQLAHPDFLGDLADILRESGIDPSLLEIEITETTMMNYVEEILSRLHEIKTLGVNVTVDDFGTGYSSFGYLKRFPLDSLKLDRTFVTGIEHREDRAIVRSLITVAQALGMKVTAEGVESRMQFEILADSRCDHIQGFLTGRPMALPEFERFALAAETR
ncbi:MAG TPA: EAL domain-containing protein [Candidatus Baltobacteraceae bacterium]|nr:EAL domain-containing protein [Candidatus Baltobacteraceae bacterium]